MIFSSAPGSFLGTVDRVEKTVKYKLSLYFLQVVAFYPCFNFLFKWQHPGSLTSQVAPHSITLIRITTLKVLNIFCGYSENCHQINFPEIVNLSLSPQAIIAIIKKKNNPHRLSSFYFPLTHGTWCEDSNSKYVATMWLLPLSWHLTNKFKKLFFKKPKYGLKNLFIVTFKTTTGTCLEYLL